MKHSAKGLALLAVVPLAVMAGQGFEPSDRDAMERQPPGGGFGTPGADSPPPGGGMEPPGGAAP
ncbi:hypothetical protein, partial [Ectothiorhodospira haloalkaliphila]